MNIGVRENKTAFTLPADFVTQTSAIIAKKRRGKTYTASVMAEELIKAKLPFVALDPTGAWWGLRASANGRQAGYPVVIIGGDHGDIPLEPAAGAVIADLVVEHPGYYIIDMSAMNSNAEQDRFAMEFGERLYRAKNNHRFPMMLFVDEADAFIPQQPMPDQRRMLGAYDTIVRRGGIRGIGICLISQRPAVVNKSVLSQVECLITLQVVGKNDRDAIDSWVSAHGSKGAREKLMATIASLDLGEAWFWSPAWLDTFERVRIRTRETFNSSKTPEVGDQPVQPKVLAPVDLARIRERVADTIERVKAEDPKRLRQRIAELERELKGAKPMDPAALKAAEERGWNKAAAKYSTQIAHLINRMQKIVELATYAADDVDPVQARCGPVQPQPKVIPPTRRELQVGLIKHAKYKVHEDHGRVVGDQKLGGGERKILTALAQYPDGRTRTQVAILCAYASSGGCFRNYLGSLRTRGLIVGDEHLKITEDGIATLGPYTPLPTGGALLQHWLGQLGKAEREILSVLAEIYPSGLDKEGIAARTESQYEPEGGGFRNALGRLRSLELIQKDGGGGLHASNALFDQ